MPSGAWARTVERDGAFQVEGRLLLHPEVDRATGQARAGVWLRMAAGWHVYWRNPGESGLPTRVDWRLEGVAADGDAEIRPEPWPVPRVYDEADGLFTTFGYDGAVLLPARVRWSPGAGSGPTLHADVELLACRSECVPGRLVLSRPLSAPVADAGRVRRIFRKARAARPLAPEELDLRLGLRLDRSAPRPGEGFRARLRAESCVSGADASCRPLAPAPGAPVFLSEVPEGLPWKVESLSAGDGAGRAFALDLVAGAEVADADPPGLRGILRLRDETGRLVGVAVDLPLPAASAAASLRGEDWALGPPDAEAGLPGRSAPGAALAGLGGWLRILGLALLGGLVLNAMPCVLPILAIKACAVAELARESRREVAAHGAAYTAGVLASMWALASVVALLRLAGREVGWGFQFQEPLYVLAVCALVVAFALNLFGVFEISWQGGSLGRLGAQAAGLRRSFFEGLLAVVLATPCTAPFLGTAVGLAFAGSVALIFAVFSAVGAGLALPFALVSLAPGWARFVPRSGPWMLQLRAGLGFALLASAVWLLWIAGRSLGVDALAGVLALLVALSFALWAMGRLQQQGSGWARGAAAAALALVLAAPLVIELEPAGAEADPSSRPAPGTEGWEPHSAEALSRILDSGRPALVVYTADWCITCKVNEKAVLADEEVQEALQRLGFAVLRADWTRRDETIRRELARFGRAGVPLYLLYDPALPEAPTVLPELLRKSDLIESLRRVAGKGPPSQHL